MLWIWCLSSQCSLDNSIIVVVSWNHCRSGKAWCPDYFSIRWSTNLRSLEYPISVFEYYVAIAVQKTAIITIILIRIFSYWNLAIVAISYDIDTFFY